MAEEAIPSAADPQRSRIPSTRLPSLAELYAAQQLGQSSQANSYTLPELYALEQAGAPLDLAPSRGTNSPQQSQSPAAQDQSLPILVDKSGAPLQPEPLTPGERLSGAARTAAHATVGDLADYLEALGRTAFGVMPKSTQALREANEGFEKVGRHPSEDAATFNDHFADIGAERQRFGNAYPEQATAAQLTPLLAGFGTTRLLAGMLSGERLAGAATARAAPQVFAPLARRLSPELAEGAPAAASAAAKAEPEVTSIIGKEEPAVPSAAAQTETAPDAVGSPLIGHNRRNYSVAAEVRLIEKPVGTGRRGHIREANEDLLRRKESDPEYADLLQSLGINLERNRWGGAPRRPPKGWTWHHHPYEEGLMQLMPRSQHEARELQAILHPFKYGAGGFARWGHKYVIPGASTGAIWSTQHPDAQTDDSPQQQPEELY
ncbi:MAG: HNH endonuclease [Xanthobacteraceae bacterium]|nr:HNH endonuclease [Xanthobacteraceae bacterium]